MISPPEPISSFAPILSSTTNPWKGVAIAVGSVAIPEYLNRLPIVTLTGESQLELPVFDR
jgi:hypothetical protein